MIKYFDKNDIGVDYIVGDIHGEKTKLMKHLNRLNFNFDTDRLFCCGDLIDRGLESFESLMLMYEPWFFSVRGNHEQMMIDSIDDERSEYHWYMNGGLWANNMDKGDIKFYSEEIKRFLPHQIQVGSVGVVHADVGKEWKELEGDQLVSCLWDRSRIKNHLVYGESVDGIDKLYVGHTPTEEKVVIGNVHYMDSGAVFGNDFRMEKIQ